MTKILKFSAYLCIATSISGLVVLAYRIGLYVGERHLIVQAMKAGVCRLNFQTGQYEWITH